MRKIFVLSLIALLVMGATAFASSEILSGDNAVILGPHMGPQGKTPPTTVIKVYVSDSAMISGSYSPDGSDAKPYGGRVGDVMVWDLAQGDGYSVKYLSSDWDTSGANTLVAGVLVTPVSRDSGSLSTPKGSGSNVGYMAVGGFTQARMRNAECTVGDVLVPLGATLARSFGTRHAAGVQAKQWTSQDIGILLTKKTADTICHIYLR